MALILCPECKKQISETSSACPSCGYDFKAAKTKLEQAQAAKGCGIGCLVIVVIAVVMSLFSSDKDSTSTGDRPKTGESGTIRLASGGEAPVAISLKGARSIYSVVGRQRQERWITNDFGQIGLDRPKWNQVPCDRIRNIHI